jgi:hypothetical protein
VDAVFDSSANEYKLYFENKWKWDAQAIFLATAPRDVLLSPSCNVSAGNNITITQGNSTTLHATGATLYRWLPETGLDYADIADPVAVPDTTTTYTVLAVSLTCIDTATVTVSVLPAGISGGDEEGTSNFRIYPNPAGDFVIIKPTDKTKNYFLEISDVTGRTVFNNYSTGKTTIRTGHLPAGVYSVRMISEKFTRTGKLIIQ